MKTYSDRELQVIVALALLWSGLANASRFTVFDGQSVVAITYDRQAEAPIRKAADLLSHDLTRLTGRTPVVGAEIASGGDGVIVGLASSPYIAQLLRQNGISTAPIAGTGNAGPKVSCAVTPRTWPSAVPNA